MILGQTKNTLGDILRWLEMIGKERPDDHQLIIDLTNVISHHVKLISELKKVDMLSDEVVAKSVNEVLFSK